jgi:uncharacterized protein HemX
MSSTSFDHCSRASHEQHPPSRARMLAGILVGASLMLGALGFYVLKRTREADEMMRQAVAKAAGSVEAENARKLKEADDAFWAAQKAAASASARAATPAPRPARKPKVGLPRPQAP